MRGVGMADEQGEFHVHPTALGELTAPGNRGGWNTIQFVVICVWATKDNK